MAKRRYATTERRIERLQKEKRGCGLGAAYKPYLTIHDLSSKGRSSRVVSATTGRTMHLLSDLERAVMLDFDWELSVIDLREQFPLERLETIAIAESMGVRHPADPETQVDVVMTTDFLISLSAGGRSRDVAVAVKYAKDLEDDRTIDKLEIERRYWAARGVAWICITEVECSKVRTSMLMWIGEWLDLAPLKVPEPDHWENRCALLLSALSEPVGDTVAAFFAVLEQRWGWRTGDALSAFRHLAATRQVVIDVDSTFDVRGPIGQVRLPIAAPVACPRTA